MEGGGGEWGWRAEGRGQGGWLLLLSRGPLWAAWPSASVPRRSTGLPALPREPNDFILMGHDAAQGNR